MKLIHKLIIGFLMVALLIWASGYCALKVSKKTLLDHYVERNGTIANEMLHEVDKYIYGKIETFQAYSSDETVRTTLVDSNRAFQKMKDMQAYISNIDEEWISPARDEETPMMHKIFGTSLSRELIELKDFYNEKYGRTIIREISATNRFGAVVAATNKTTDFRQDDEEWWQTAKKEGMYIKDIGIDDSSQEYSVDISIGIADTKKGGSSIGVLKVVLSINEIKNILKEIYDDEVSEDKASSKVVLATKDKRLIYSSNDKDVFMSDISYLTASEDPLPEGSDASNVYNSSIINERGQDMFVVHAHSKGYRDFKGLGWMLIVERKAEDVFAPVTILRNQILSISFIVTFLAVMLGVFFSTNIVRSVRKLRDAAIKIGRGELDTRIDIDSDDEIGELGKEFKNMAENLRNTTVQLDEFAREVAERKQTEELLLQSRQDWAETFDTITDIITVHDINYNIIRANKAAEQILNIPGNEYSRSVKCFRHYHGTDTPPAGCPSCNCLNTGEPATFEVFEPHLNSHVEIRSIPRFNSNNELIGLIHVARDVSKRKQDEELIRTQLDRQNALRSIDRAIIGSIDLKMTLEVFIDQVLAQMKIDAASVLLLNKQTHTLDYVVSKGFRSNALKYTKLRLGESHAGRAAVERQIITVPDLKKNPEAFAGSKHFSAEDFVAYIAIPLIAKGHVKGVLELFHRSPIHTSPDWLEFLEAIADQGAIAVDNATMFDDLQRSNMELTLAYDTTIEGWSRAMDLRDSETEGHSRRVTDLTLQVALEMGISDDQFLHIRRGALLHDIGKIGIPDNILLKPGALTEEEWIVMKRHPEYAYNMLFPISYLRPAIDIPHCHHEKWDGTGYPRGLKGEEIPLSARIFAVVDVWDALRSERPYRKAWPEDKVIAHIRALSGTHFDPAVVEIFLKITYAKCEGEKVCDRSPSSSPTPL